jgi:NADH-quinone oxidoreductase subunit A
MRHFLNVEYLTYSTLLVSIVLALVISAVVLALSFILAIQTPDPEKTSAYECGFEPFEDARNKFDVRFYIVAILFIIFDIEVVFLFP